MNPEALIVAGMISGGFLMGLSGSLHCACQCGGIATSLLVATGQGRSSRDRAQVLLVMQLGRTATYSIGGGIVGVAGVALGHIFGLAGIRPVLRIMGAAMLLWVGLAMIGIVPGPRLLDRHLIAASTKLRGRGRGSAVFRRSSALFLGMTWGAAPCAMVYNALMTAMLSGSPVTGALFMMSFGLATVPAVALTALGATQVVAMGSKLHKVALRTVVGVAIAALGLVSTIMPAASLTALCIN